MLRSILSWVAARLGRQRDSRGEGTDSDDAAESDEEEFLPSRLDASVLKGHGMGTSQAEREMADVEEHAQRLEEEHRRE